MDSRVAYFVLSFFFESRSYVDIMTDFKGETKGKRSSQECIFIFTSFLRVNSFRFLIFHIHSGRLFRRLSARYRYFNADNSLSLAGKLVSPIEFRFNIGELFSLAMWIFPSKRYLLFFIVKKLFLAVRQLPVCQFYLEFLLKNCQIRLTENNSILGQSELPNCQLPNCQTAERPTANRTNAFRL